MNAKIILGAALAAVITAAGCGTAETIKKKERANVLNFMPRMHAIDVGIASYLGLKGKMPESLDEVVEEGLLAKEALAASEGAGKYVYHRALPEASDDTPICWGPKGEFGARNTRAVLLKNHRAVELNESNFLDLMQKYGLDPVTGRAAAK